MRLFFPYNFFEWHFPQVSSIFPSFKLKDFADDNFKLEKIAESSSNGKKTMWEKDKIVTSNVSFTPKDFYRRHVKTRACLGKVLKH